jgi:hypothetical protein
VAAGAGLAVAAYAACAGVTWLTYGHAKRRAAGEDADSLLDEFMPEYEVGERLVTRIAAPVAIAFAAACETNPEQSAIVRAIFRTRALFLRGKPSQKPGPLPLIEQAKIWGWGVLAERPGREVVFGGVTQPWLADPEFRALLPDEFRAFYDPGNVKIAWTLRADPVDAANSQAVTETRAVTTDLVSRAKFRRYWSFVMPGTVLIRKLALRLVKAEAERRARDG